MERCKKCGQVLASGEVGICADCYPDDGDETVLVHDPRVLARVQLVEEDESEVDGASTRACRGVHFAIADKNGYRHPSTQLRIDFTKHTAELEIFGDHHRGTVEEMLQVVANRFFQFQLRVIASHH